MRYSLLVSTNIAFSD